MSSLVRTLIAGKLLLALGVTPVKDDPAPELQRALAAAEALPVTAKSLGEQSRLFHFLAEADDDSALHTRGLAVAERALALDPDEPSALLWWAIHRGSQASLLNPVAAIRIAREIEAALLKLRGLSPGFEHSAADRILGHVYQVAPAGISIGSAAKAKEHVLAAVERDPDYPPNQLSYGQWLLKARNCGGAEKAALAVLGSPFLVSQRYEGARWRKDGQRLLKEARKKCDSN